MVRVYPVALLGTGSFECTNALISTTMLPVTPGMGVTFDTGLMVSTALENGPSSVDPSPGMTLSGIELFDASGNPITDFSLTSGSGAVYGADGLVSEPTSATPEPSMTWLLAAGIFLAIASARARQRQSLKTGVSNETLHLCSRIASGWLRVRGHGLLHRHSEQPGGYLGNRCGAIRRRHVHASNLGFRRRDERRRNSRFLPAVSILSLASSIAPAT